VTDTGIGIAREYQEVIFDSFKQVDDSHSREYGGTGLGLAIANKLLNCLGGTLHLESVLGRGSTFTVYVPYRAPVSQIEEPISTDETTNSDDGAFESLVVLVAEDNPVNRRYIRHVLEKVSATPIEADNGQQVIDILCEQVVDIVVMDCQMPVLDGLEVTAIIREAESKVGGHLPIIAVTAHAMKQDIDQCLAVGMDEHLSKPFKADQLRTMIRQAMKTKAEPVVGSLQDQLTKIHNS
jgi:CheY-like chemotaxis protein